MTKRQLQRTRTADRRNHARTILRRREQAAEKAQKANVRIVDRLVRELLQAAHQREA